MLNTGNSAIAEYHSGVGEGYTSGTFDTPAEAVITKALTMPAGTETPAGSAKFAFTRVSVDGVTGTTENMPCPADVEIAFVTTDTGSTDAGTGTKTVTKESGGIFGGVGFLHAGVYVYTVAESVAASFTGLVNSTTTAETMDFSEAVYRVTVVVANEDGGSGLYVKYIAVQQTMDDEGAAVTDTVKVNSEPTIDDSGNGFLFTNNFNRRKLTDPTDPDANDDGLYVGNLVAGDIGDKTQYFDYAVTITAPATAISTSYIACIAELGNSPSTIVTDTTANSVTNVTPGTGGYFTIASGANVTLKLKHNQRLVFTDMLVGTTYTAGETDAATGYTVTAAKVQDGVSSDVSSTRNSIAGAVGESNNSVTVTNTRNSTTPTGILIDNLPFILLIFASVGGLAAYFAIRQHRAYKRRTKTK
jgi:hypothetical protein